MLPYTRASLMGRMPVMMRPPSRGGIGIRLKTHMAALTLTPAAAMRRKKGSRNWKLASSTSSTIQPRPMAKLAAGPASATQAICFFGLRRRAKSTGTGFA